MSSAAMSSAGSSPNPPTASGPPSSRAVNPASSSTRTPSCSALAAFEPGSAPTTTNAVFFDTLLDENAASHVALGNAYSFGAGPEDADRLNTSAIHVDFMIGSDAMEVDGVRASGDAVPLLRGGAWQL